MSNPTTERAYRQRIAEELETPVEEANALAQRLGLDPFPVNYWIVDYDEMNELIAYGGFQHRYPHWRWGMQYDRQQKQGQFLGGKAFEIVNNDDPSQAFLQESNELADQKAVITHVEAHADFFKNNEWFKLFDESPDAAAMLEGHAETVSEYMDDPEIDREAVEAWIDHVLCLEDNIDQHQPFRTAENWIGESAELEDAADRLGELRLSDEVRDQVFSEAWLDAQEEDPAPVSAPEEPQKDILAFLSTHGMRYDGETGKAVEFEQWQRELLEILRKESYYFAPQRMTKVMNEGWACVTPETLVQSPAGLVPMEEIVETHAPVSDGDSPRAVYDSHIIEDEPTISIETEHGFRLEGSERHRVRSAEGTWVSLAELAVGDGVQLAGGQELWPSEPVTVDWGATSGPANATETGQRARTAGPSRLPWVGTDDGRSDSGRLPSALSPAFGRLLGAVAGAGRIECDTATVSVRSQTEGAAQALRSQFDELFGVSPTVERIDDGWRVQVGAPWVARSLQDAFELPSDGTAVRGVPEELLRSPRAAVRAYLEGLADAAGAVDAEGVRIAVPSMRAAQVLQQLLLNFGILASSRPPDTARPALVLEGAEAASFERTIGFRDRESRERLATYTDGVETGTPRQRSDRIVEIERGAGTVYDISVEETHRYVGGGFLNHNSYWESTMMTDERFAGDDEFLSYADHMARVLGSGGLNPYKLGMELWEYVENYTNRSEVVERLLCVDGVTWRNFGERVDLDRVLGLLEPASGVARITPDALERLDSDDPRVDAAGLSEARAGEVDVERNPWKVLSYEGLCERHYSLVKPQNRGFLKRISNDELERTARYLFDIDRYDTVDDAIEAVDRTAGWARMREIRESHNDITFLDAFLTQEFVDTNDYFTYEYTHTTQDYRVTSVDYEEVKKKLMLQFTNFGKPTITVIDANFQNRNELLLAHQYNGVMLDMEQAQQVLERVFELWGRPVNLNTIVKEVDEHDVEVARRRDREPSPTEQGKRIRFDGERFQVEDLSQEETAAIAADDVDYDTKPEEWLG